MASSITNSATNIGFGPIKSTEASGEYEAKMREKIINRYNSLPDTRSMMLSQLKGDAIRGSDVTAMIMS